MPNAYAWGSLVRQRFGFPNRVLTDVEKATFLAGGGLPAGVGFDPTTVKFDHKAPGLTAWTTVTYPTTIVKDATGEYHIDIDTTPATIDGDWLVRPWATGTGQSSVYDSFVVERR